MDEQEKYQSRDLRIHRKYVLVISFVLLFLKTGGVSIEQINFIGATFKFENINAIYWALWILLFYSLLRYRQYFLTQSTGGGLLQPYKEYRELVFKPRIKILINKRIPDGGTIKLLDEEQYPYFNHLKRTSKWGRTVIVKYTIPTSKGIQQKGYEIELNLIKDFGFLYFKLWGLFLLNRPAIFEFIFPFILGIFTIIYCNVISWPGSLINLM